MLWPRTLEVQARQQHNPPSPKAAITRARLNSTKSVGDAYTCQVEPIIYEQASQKNQS